MGTTNARCTAKCFPSTSSGSKTTFNTPATSKLTRNELLKKCSLYLQGFSKIKYQYLKEQCNQEKIFALILVKAWLNDSHGDHEMAITNFNFFESNCKRRIRGGVCIYLQQCCTVNSFYSIKFSNSFCDTIALCIKKENIALICIYRPPECSIIEYNEMLSERNK